MNLGTRQRRNARRAGARVGQDLSPALARDTDIPLGLAAPPQSDTGLPPGYGCGPGIAPTCDEKIIALTQTVPAAGEAVFRFTTPGAFCPKRMYVMSDDLELIFIGSIKSGLDEQIIRQPSGIVIPAELFAIDNDCCPVACLPCICQPAVPYEIAVVNGDVTDEDVTIIIVGTYLDVSDPRYQTENGCPPRFLTDMHAEGCPPNGGDKIIPINILFTPSQPTVDVRLETPGAFCPRALFLSSTGGLSALAVVNITRIQSGIKHQIISGTLPANLFSLANECCTIACFDCICKPGYPLTIGFSTPAFGEGTIVVLGALIGTYDDACQ